MFYDAELGREISFEVPRSHWEPVLSALRPATPDSSPAKWKGLGELDIVTTDGEPFWVGLYSLRGQPVGAFSAGQNHARRKYYRGGSTDTLINAMKAALKSHRAQAG